MSRTRKRRWEELEDDKRDAFNNKYEHEVKTYKNEISLQKDKIKKFDILKLQNEDSLDKQQAYTKQES